MMMQPETLDDQALMAFEQWLHDWADTSGFSPFLSYPENNRDYCFSMDEAFLYAAGNSPDLNKYDPEWDPDCYWI